MQVEPNEVMLIAITGSGPSEFGYPNKSEHIGNGMSYTNSATCNSHTRSMLIWWPQWNRNTNHIPITIHLTAMFYKSWIDRGVKC